MGTRVQINVKDETRLKKQKKEKSIEMPAFLAPQLRLKGCSIIEILFLRVPRARLRN